MDPRGRHPGSAALGPRRTGWAAGVGVECRPQHREFRSVLARANSGDARDRKVEQSFVDSLRTQIGADDERVRGGLPRHPGTRTVGDRGRKDALAHIARRSRHARWIKIVRGGVLRGCYRRRTPLGAYRYAVGKRDSATPRRGRSLAAEVTYTGIRNASSAAATLTRAARHSARDPSTIRAPGDRVCWTDGGILLRPLRGTSRPAIRAGRRVRGEPPLMPDRALGSSLR